MEFSKHWVSIKIYAWSVDVTKQNMSRYTVFLGAANEVAISGQ